MFLQPDLDTFMVNPWEEDKYVARIICDIMNPDKTPFEGCARTNLKRVLAEINNMGYTANFGPEMEFYIFERDEQNRPTTKTKDRASYFDLSPIDLGEELRRDTVSYTHLDVYKRQDLIRVNRKNLEEVNEKILNYCAQPVSREDIIQLLINDFKLQLSSCLLYTSRCV